MKIYTPQMLNTFVKCPTEYYLKYVKKIPIPALEDSFISGKNIHAIAANYLNKKNINKYVLTDYEKKLWSNVLACEYFHLNPVKTEMSISTKIDKYWIGGRIDALVKDNLNNYYILDYKTGHIPEDADENFQTIIYLLCCNSFINDSSSLSFVYIGAKDNSYKKIDLTNDLKNTYETTIKNICDKISILSQANVQKSNKCQCCEYKKICI